VIGLTPPGLLEINQAEPINQLTRLMLVQAANATEAKEALGFMRQRERRCSLLGGASIRRCYVAKEEEPRAPRPTETSMKTPP